MNSWRFTICLLGTLAAPARAQVETRLFEICEFDQKAEQTHVLFKVPGVVDVGSIVWNPEAEQFAISVTVTGKDGNAQQRIRTCRRDGSEMQDIGRGQWPSWSPRGRRLTVSRSSPDPGVWIMRADGTDAQIIDSRGWSSRWSPDGNQIAYLRNDLTPSEVRIFNIVEGHFRRVRNDESPADTNYSEGFTWSPDGTRLCCPATSDSGSQQLVILNTRTGKHHSLSAAFMISHPVICWPDENRLWFTQHEPTDRKIAEVAFAAALRNETILPLAGAADDSVFGPEVDRPRGTLLFIRAY